MHASSLGLKFTRIYSYRMSMPDNLESGTTFIETLWFSYACRIIDMATQVYQLNEEQIQMIKEKFLKRGEYLITIN